MEITNYYCDIAECKAEIVDNKKLVGLTIQIFHLLDEYGSVCEVNREPHPLLRRITFLKKIDLCEKCYQKHLCKEGINFFLRNGIKTHSFFITPRLYSTIKSNNH